MSKLESSINPPKKPKLDQPKITMFTLSNRPKSTTSPQDSAIAATSKPQILNKPTSATMTNPLDLDIVSTSRPQILNRSMSSTSPQDLTVASTSRPQILNRLDRESENITVSDIAKYPIKYDIANFIKKVKQLTLNEKYDLLINVYYPEKKFKFPITEQYGKKRSFCYIWLENFKWLVYSPSLDGAFCINCVTFPDFGDKMELFRSKPFQNWTKAVNKFKQHMSYPSHTNSAAMCLGLKSSIQSKKPIIEMIDHGLSNLIAKNRKILASIIKTVIFCGKQNIALRGHRDDSSHIQNVLINSGNFQKLLEFRTEAGDIVLAEHFKTAGKNNTYRSKTIQNEILDCCGDYLINDIVSHIKSFRYFAILADEATDCSNKEQMALIIRYIDSEKKTVCEDFVGFILCDEGVTGEAIAEKLKMTVTNIGLNMENCRGQCYDGAGSMAGLQKGAAARIKTYFPKAFYVHCNSHLLNLAVVKACGLQEIRNMMSSLTELAYFFNCSPKRQDVLVHFVKEIIPESRKQKLVDLCRTRWLERLNALDVILSLFEPVMAALNKIKNASIKSFNQESITKANGLYFTLESSTFIISLVVCSNVLAYTQSLTIKLQSKTLEYHVMGGIIKNVISTLEDVRSKIDLYNHEWFLMASKIAENIDTTISCPRICKKQVHRSNINVANQTPQPEDYFRCSITIPFVDHLIKELKDRFSSNQMLLLKGFSILPNNLSTVDSLEWKKEFMDFFEQYVDDMPNPTGISAELDLWQNFWLKQFVGDQMPLSVSQTLNLIDLETFPNIVTSLIIIGVAPVTTCECERSFSRLKRLKTYSRNTMVEDRLNALALLHTHYDKDIDIETLINIFEKKHPRRMALSNILKE